MISLMLPFPPSVNTLFRDGRRGSGKRPRTARYLTWIRAATNEAMAQATYPILGPVSINIILGAPDNRRRDCSNYIKAIEDLLVNLCFIQGDDRRFVKAVSISWAASEASLNGALVQITEVP